MQRSEAIFYFDKSNSSSEFIRSFAMDNSKIEHELDGMFFDDRSVAENAVISNDSFTSTNSSIFRQSHIISEENVSLDNPDLRGLICHILTKLECLEDQNKLQKENFENLLKDYDKKFYKLRKLNDYLTDEIDNIYDEMYAMDTRLVHVEQYSRRESLIISGIPDSVKQAELEPMVLNILRRMGLNDVSSYAISACHRLYKNKNDKYSIIKFTIRKIVEYCFHHRERLPQVSRDLKLNLRFFESLCKANEQTLKLCKRLQDNEHIEEYNVTNGSIRIKKKDSYKSIKIKHPDEIYEMFKDFFEYDDLYIT